ncbi:fungal-specific transcription factor domain-containing protein [Schizophyllum commune]
MASSYTPLDQQSFPDQYYPTRTFVKREEDADPATHLRLSSPNQDPSSLDAQQPASAHPFGFPLSQSSSRSTAHSSPAIQVMPPSLIRHNTGTQSQEDSPSSSFMSTPWTNVIPSPVIGDSSNAASNQHRGSHSPGEEDDDVTPLVTLRPDSSLEAPGMSGSHEKMVRRRSSKACDQCRKSKCKCERSAQGDDCKNCVMLGVPCTFLGPSRKRGPPKGYIDAIEARLHQVEALIGIMLYSAEVRMDREHGVVDREPSEHRDERAAGILRDMAQDPLAREILCRVDNSAYGVQGRNRQQAGPKFRQQEDEGASELSSALSSMHPSNEWQDRVTLMMRKTRRDASGSSARQGAPHVLRNSSAPFGHRSGSTSSSEDAGPHDSSRRQRRRVAHDDGMLTPSASGDPYARHNLHRTHHSFSSLSVQPPNDPYVSSSDATSPTSPAYQPSFIRRTSLSSRYPTVPQQSSYASDDEDDDTPAAVTSGIGELSLNEDEQVRYHGRASGLHLLSNTERHDRRNEGGIWRFPKARVWPPVSNKTTRMTLEAADEEYRCRLPELRVQEELLDLYFSYVQTAFPIVHKQSFLDTFKSMTTSASHESPGSPASDHSQSRSPFNRGPPRVPLLLLFAMFSIAARYSDNAPASASSRGLAPSTQEMWDAGDEYLRTAKLILGNTYSASRPSTVQALLLMGYREIGIGAMAEAWTYIGMAVRMAQDLGMHRTADGWSRTRLGGKLFSEEELSERKRIWYGCVIMDKYVSAYIGRPLGIFERDFDTPLPSANDPEEYEDCKPYSSLCSHERMRLQAVPGRSISCFNASATLSNILSMIIQAVYSVRSGPTPDDEVQYLEGLLDRWYIALPEHLRRDPGFANQTAPLPHVLALHMQYWCAVLLLHRPSIKHIKKNRGASTLDGADLARSEKSYDLCASAANQITSLLTMYVDYYPINRCPTFLCYYIFTASIMHVTALSWRPDDPQARMGLSKCLSALQMMEVIWPAAGRALELLSGAKISAPNTDQLTPLTERHKRQPDQSVDDLYRSHGQSEVYRDIILRANNGTLPYISDEEAFAAQEGTQPLPGPSSLPNLSFDQRWPPTEPMPYSGSVPSTGISSSLPQSLYGVGAASHPRVPSGSEQPPHGQRYPSQYYQELSEYQLNQYDSFPDQFMLPPPPPPASQQYPSQMYGSEFNNVFSE